MDSSSHGDVQEIVHSDFPARPGTNICLRTPSGEGAAPRTVLFYLEDAILTRASPVFRDMFTLGQASEKEQVLKLDEDGETVAYLLFGIQQDDVTKLPDAAKMATKDLVNLLTAALKYQIISLQIIVEQGIRLQMRENPYMFDIDQMVSLMTLACSNDRTALVKDVISAVTTRSTNLSGDLIQRICKCLDGEGSALLLQRLGQKLQGKTTTLSAKLKGLENWIPELAPTQSATRTDFARLLRSVSAELAGLQS